MKHILIFFIFFPMIVNADFFEFPKIESPKEFQHNFDFRNAVKGFAVTFKKGHQLLWEISPVDNFTIREDNLYSVLYKGIIQLKSGECGGIATDENVSELIINNNTILASDKKFIFLYFVPECAMYNKFTAEGVEIGLTENVICERNKNKRVVRDVITGNILYKDEKDSLAVYALNNFCYFMDSKSEVERVGKENDQYQATIVYNAGIEIKYATNSSGGFLGEADDIVFSINFADYEQPTLTIVKKPSSECIITSESENFFCFTDIDNSFLKKVKNADKIIVGKNNFYLLTNEKLSSYSKSVGWIKEAFFFNKLPIGCTFNNELYYIAIDSKKYHLKNKQAEQVDKIPEKCNFSTIKYSEGVFYSNDNDFVYRYSEIVKRDKGIKLLRVSNKDEFIFYLE